MPFSECLLLQTLNMLKLSFAKHNVPETSKLRGLCSATEGTVFAMPEQPAGLARDEQILGVNIN